MCGFAGVVTWDEKFRVSRETLARMSARIAHRGPDGEGFYFSPDAEITPDRPQIALAHRRLAILDPDPRANQPFTDNAGRWLVFNGEIYNFRELRAELSKLKPGYEWRTHCDTEVLLVAYDQWGEKCVDHLNGMFAFAVWDEPKKALFLARDRMGQKPLYFAVVPPGYTKSRPWGESVKEIELRSSAIAFASEIPCLRDVSWVDTTVETYVLADYLQWGYVGPCDTIYRGVDLIEPGETRRYNGNDKFKFDRYFSPNRWVGDFRPRSTAPGGNMPDESAIASTRSLLTSAVQRQVVSDVPIGCFLSGGIDSSIIAASMVLAVGAGEAVHTFSIGFEDSRYDESQYAARVAEHLGTKHQTFIVKPDVVEDIAKIAAVFGEPFGDSSALPTHYLARETRRYVKVVLSGDGGDELFGGYDRYRALYLASALKRVAPPGVALLLRATAGLYSGGHPKGTWARFRRFASSLDISGSRRYLQYMRLFDASLLNQLCTGELRKHAKRQRDNIDWRVFRSAPKNSLYSDDVTAALATDRIQYLPGDLLTKVDRASMLHALEVRSPFMDHELVRFAAGLTSDQLLKGGPKRMLREAFAQDLPTWVFKRKKMGFAVPIGDWFRGELRPMLRDHLFAADSFAAGHFNRPVVERLVDEHETGRNDHSQRLYALLMLELWWRQQDKAEK